MLPVFSTLRVSPPLGLPAQSCHARVRFRACKHCRFSKLARKFSRNFGEPIGETEDRSVAACRDSSGGGTVLQTQTMRARGTACPAGLGSRAAPSRAAVAGALPLRGARRRGPQCPRDGLQYGSTSVSSRNGPQRPRAVLVMLHDACEGHARSGDAILGRRGRRPNVLVACGGALLTNNGDDSGADVSPGQQHPPKAGRHGETVGLTTPP